ncbi:hypothetical protein LCGC14_0703930 [marine sediment metagenome]|uniref:TPM domain-containing protein n=2 Tax=root TaxID=1 RepID=A0A831QN09_9FLAO|nr:TPM domain-containing protein [Pricia antarctica]
MSKVEDFLSAEEEQDIVQAILTAEKRTSGEIRVHIEAHTQLPHFERAKEVFKMLKMGNTKDGTGVLIYVAVNDRKFAICGDHGINKAVPNDFWDTTRDTIQSQFKKNNFKQGIIDGILMAGKELQTHFPWQQGDINELSNEVSKG